MAFNELSIIYDCDSVSRRKLISFGVLKLPFIRRLDSDATRIENSKVRVVAHRNPVSMLEHGPAVLH